MIVPALGLQERGRSVNSSNAFFDADPMRDPGRSRGMPAERTCIFRGGSV